MAPVEDVVMNRAITVIITAYNLETYIDNCMQELQGQTFQNFSILVVDDASTDKTLSRIMEWKKTFGNRMNVISLKQNLGMPALARNTALESGLVDGSYVLFLDGDDSIEPHMLEKLYEAVVKNNAGVSICAYDRVDASKARRVSVEMQGFPKCVDGDEINDIIPFINTAPWNKLWKKDVIDGLRYSSFRVGEEVAFNFFAYIRCERVCFLDEVLIHYRVRNNSVIAATDENSIWMLADELAKLHKNVDSLHKDAFEMVSFIHVGLSMALRAALNPNICLRIHIKKTAAYFSQRYNWLKSNRVCTFFNLSKRGLKGLAIWGCLLLYRLNMFALPLFIYKKMNLKIKF